MKKLLAFTLCFIMVLSCSIPAFAAELPYNEATQVKAQLHIRLIVAFA